MEDAIVIIILLIVIVLALLRAQKHFKSGGCCGSGSTVIRSKKKLTDPKLGEKTLVVEGMHCENCQAGIENALNRFDGVVCKANLKKKTAVVLYSKEVSAELLKETIENMGYTVTEIR